MRRAKPSRLVLELVLACLALAFALPTEAAAARSAVQAKAAAADVDAAYQRLIDATIESDRLKRPVAVG